MVDRLISPGERELIVQGVEHDMRTDGRTRTQYRDIVLETGVLTNASGSCRVKVAGTELLVGVKVDVAEPDPLTPELGHFVCSVDCASMATHTPPTQDLSNELTQLLARQLAVVPHHAATDPRTSLFRQLGIVPGETCWVVSIDVLVLAIAGNLVDALFLATHAALRATRIPRTTLVHLAEGRTDFEIDDTMSDGLCGIEAWPLCVTVNKIGHHHILDATLMEEQVAAAKLYVFVSREGKITHVEKTGEGGIEASVLREMTQSGRKVAQQLHVQLDTAIKLEQEQERSAKKAGLTYKKWGFFA